MNTGTSNLMLCKSSEVRLARKLPSKTQDTCYSEHFSVGLLVLGDLGLPLVCVRQQLTPNCNRTMCLVGRFAHFFPLQTAPNIWGTFRGGGGKLSL
jgi:hypothetical protein